MEKKLRKGQVESPRIAASIVPVCLALAKRKGRIDWILNIPTFVVTFFRRWKNEIRRRPGEDRRDGSP